MKILIYSTILAGLIGISHPTSATDGRFVNLSTRALVETGDEVMIGGFIIEDGSQEVLIEAIGPELANKGITNALADPVLTVTRSSDGMVLMVNDNWEDSQGQLVSDLWGGSPNLAAGSASSAVVLTLDPGNYSAKVEGKNGTTGVAIIEVYGIVSRGSESSDRTVLMGLYNATDGANWTRSDNWGTDVPLDLWYGVKADGNGRVTKLRLGANQLSGPMPAELGNLAYLENLGLSSNQLSGPIPSELGQLAYLEGLWLFDNQLSGPIPAELGNLANLEVLGLFSNQLNGPIPAQLGQLADLEGMWLYDNQLSGPIPAQLGNLANLEVLSLFRNQLNGPIPAQLGQLGNLQYLSLHINQLSGPIPAQLGNLTNLERLALSNNQLNGPIPTELGNLANLERLYLYENQLSGPIPAQLGNLAYLEVLNLYGNQLNGPIPAELGNLAYLGVLWLNRNQLSGSIPVELGNLANLDSLYLGGNQLSGCIPDGLRDVAENDLSKLDLPYCGEGGQETTHRVGDTLTDLPTGSWTPDVTSDGSFSSSGGNVTIRLNDGGFIEEGNFRYTCQSSGGCVIENRGVTSGTIVQTAKGTAPGGGGMEPDTQPSFAAGSGPGDQSYTVDTAISALTLPEASGGDGTLTYSLTPSVPGLSFDANTRRLTGTPTTAGTHSMTYTVTDADGDSDSLTFTIAVQDADDSGSGGSFDLHKDHSNSRGIAYANDRFYIFRWLDNKVYAYTRTGQRDPNNDFDLTPNIFGPIHRFAFANGRFYVFHVHGADGKLFAYTITGQRDASRDLELHANNSSPRGIAYADGRFYVVDQQDSKVYAYAASGDRDAAADFDLGNDRFIWSLEGFVFANGRFYVLDGLVDKVYAYTASGQRDATADFALACDNVWAIGIAYGNGRFYVLNWTDRKIYTYTGRNADLSLCFPIGSNPGNQSYPVGMGISALTLPAARGGDGPLMYSLLPAVPGLSFNATMRRLTGTPTKIGTYNMTYRAMDIDGDTGSLTFTITVTEPEPDLVVESVSVSDDTLNEGATFTLNATVRNSGGGDAAATTLHYYESSDLTISSADTAVGTDSVGVLAASSTSAESIRLTAPSSDGTYYYGACVDSVPGETDTANNCSSAVRVTVSGGTDPPSDDYTPLEGLRVSPGLIRLGIISIGGCQSLNNNNINGVTYTTHSSKWQRRADADSAWEDVPGTEKQGELCPYSPTSAGEYRIVVDITIDNRRGSYSSENTITVN